MDTHTLLVSLTLLTYVEIMRLGCSRSNCCPRTKIGEVIVFKKNKITPQECLVSFYLFLDF